MSRQADPASRSAATATAAVRSTEELLLRSFDHRRGYDLEIELVAPDGEPVFERRYYLPPGETVSEVGSVPSGAFDVHVTMDNGVRRHRSCRIDASPQHTLVVEVGNGALSVTEGLFG